MDEVARLNAIEEIRQAKAKYLRGVDTGDSELVRSILAEDCELDYMGCCTDPRSGADHFPAMNIVMRGAASFTGGLAELGIVSAHHCPNSEIEFLGESSARGTWSMRDKLFMPAGSPFAVLTGYGFYHETYERQNGAWKIKTLRIERTRVETA